MTSVYRITQRTLTDAVGANLQSSLAKLQHLQEQLSSGRALSRPSDGPADTVAALRFRADIQRATQLKRNADDATGWLGTADNALTSGLDLINRARTLLQQGVNGSMGTADRAALANEVDQLREQAVALANTTYLGRPIFAGTSSSLQAYDGAGTYVGDNGTITRNISPNAAVAVNLTGPAVFGPSGADLFSTLSTIANDLRTNPANLGNDQQALNASFDRMNGALATVGARYNQVTTLSAKNDDAVLTATNALAGVESIDLPATIIKVQLQQTAYQAALSATASAIQRSLVDFLR